MLRTFAVQLDEMVQAALGEDADRRERAAGAAAGPWTALEEGLTAVAAAA